MSTVEKDKALIEALGGAAKVAQLLSLDKHGGIQRVHNWKTRGIPAAIKIARPDLFMRDDSLKLHRLPPELLGQPPAQKQAA